MNSPNFSPLQNDGGNPLVCRNRQGLWDLVGLLTIAPAGCQESVRLLPQLYADIGHHYNWIYRRIFDSQEKIVLDRTSTTTTTTTTTTPAPRLTNFWRPVVQPPPEFTPIVSQAASLPIFRRKHSYKGGIINAALLHEKNPISVTNSPMEANATMLVPVTYPHRLHQPLDITITKPEPKQSNISKLRPVAKFLASLKPPKRRVYHESSRSLTIDPISLGNSLLWRKNGQSALRYPPRQGRSLALSRRFLS